MPGWLRDREGQHAERASTVQEDDAGNDEGGAVAPQNPLASQRSSQSRSPSGQSLVQSQRDELLVEVLGDVALLLDKVREMSTQMKGLETALTTNDLVRWRNTLDLKFSELADINLSEQAAKRLQAFAGAYMEQMAREIETIVIIQAKKSVSDTLAFHTLFDKLQRDWLLRLGSVAGAGFIGTFLALILWRWI